MNSKSLFGNHNKIEWLIAIGCILGTFNFYLPVKISRYVLIVILQLFSFLYIQCRPINRLKGDSVYQRYLIILFLIFCILISFIMKDVDTIDIINRILPLISMYGMYIFLDSRLGLNLERIINHFVNLYLFLVLIINVDCLLFMLTGSSLWPPISWLGFRYCGPFGDPNFMALFSATIFFVVLYSHKKHKKIYLANLVLNIFLAKSFSTFAFIPLSIVLYRFTKSRSNFQKQIFILCGYFLFISLYTMYSNEIEKIFVSYLSEILGSYDSAYLKYGSLQIRLDTQSSALDIFLQDWSGQGPRQIVPQLQHDTHNSYVSMMFEQGIFGLALILMTLRGGRNSKIENIVGNFLMLSALLLNVHDITIYSIFILMQNRLKNGYLHSI